MRRLVGVVEEEEGAVKTEMLKVARVGVPIEGVTVVPPEPVRATTVQARLTVDNMLVLDLGDRVGVIVFSVDQTARLRRVLCREEGV